MTPDIAFDRRIIWQGSSPSEHGSRAELCFRARRGPETVICRVPLKAIDLPQSDARDLYGRDLALIRPDQYVAWRGDAPPSDPDRLIGRLIGAT